MRYSETIEHPQIHDQEKGGDPPHRSVEELSDTVITPSGKLRTIGEDQEAEAATNEEKRRVFQEFMLGRLEKKKYIERTVDGTMVVDMDRLSRDSAEINRNDFSILTKKHPEFKGNSAQELLANIFLGHEVVSRQEYDEYQQASDPNKEPPQAKPLFYTPETHEAAFDVETIKGMDFHLAGWDLGTSANTPAFYRAGNGEKIPMSEAMIPMLVYHPRYGDGYRDERGRLMVRDKKTGEHHPITTKWLISMGIGGSDESGVRLKDSPGLFLGGPGRALVEHDILRPNDFRSVSGSPTTEVYRAEREGVGSNGMIMFGGVRYYLGRSFHNKPVRVQKISSTMAGITAIAEDGAETLTHFFNLIPPDDPRLKKRGTSGRGGKEYAYLEADRAATNLQEFKADDFFQQRQDESGEQFRQRVESMSDFNNLLKLSRELSQKAGVNLSKFSFREQRAIGLAAKQDQAGEKVISIAKNFGEDGLRALLSSEYDPKMGELVYELAEVLPREEAQRLFKEYGGVSKIAEKFSELFRQSQPLEGSTMPDSVKSAFPEQLHEAILRRGKDLLVASHLINVKKEAPEMKDKPISRAMAGLRVMLESLASVSGASEQFNAEPIIGKSKEVVEIQKGLYAFDITDKQSGEKYKLKIFIRPQKTEDEQARINFELDFNTSQPNQELRQAFQQETHYARGNKQKRESVVRVGIDRDEREGKQYLSLDLGRNRYNGDSFTRTGDVLGNSLQLVDESGHHSVKSFSTELGEETNFRALARSLDLFLESQRLQRIYQDTSAR